MACTPRSTPIGEAATDALRLADLPRFAHYAGALDGYDAYTLGDLYEKPLVFSGRPTPTALLNEQQASNPPAAADAVPLRILTYNVGLLDVTLFGFAPYTNTPDIELRAPIFFDAVLSAGYDILMFQEVWRSVDVDRLKAAAATHGYWVATTSRKGYTDGLAIAVRSSLAAGPDEVGGEPYQHISTPEFFPANGFSRGFQYLRFSAAGIGPVVLYNTHTAPFPDAYLNRMHNVRDLTLHLQGYARDSDLVFVGGDMNAAPYYKNDVWLDPKGKPVPDWFANTLSYPILLHYGDLTDLAVRGRSQADAVADITLGDLVPNEFARSTELPLGVEGYCEATPKTVFTGVDCNVLYFQQYGGTESPARLDYVLARDPKGRVHVDSAAIAFTQDFSYGGKTGPLSDHYGQEVTVRVAP